MHDDPDPPLRRIREGDDDASYTGWAMGALLVLLFMGAVSMFFHSDAMTPASNKVSDRSSPAAPANPPSTTGSNANTDRN